jgi:hypothetical protein
VEGLLASVVLDFALTRRRKSLLDDETCSLVTFVVRGDDESGQFVAFVVCGNDECSWWVIFLVFGYDESSACFALCDLVRGLLIDADVEIRCLSIFVVLGDDETGTGVTFGVFTGEGVVGFSGVYFNCVSLGAFRGGVLNVAIDFLPITPAKA